MYAGQTKIYHKLLFDFSFLSHVLRLAGFHNIKRYDWQQTEHADFDDHSKAYLPDDKQARAANYWPADKFTLISLNVECTKPTHEL
jgi:hypothetical protein